MPTKEIVVGLDDLKKMEIECNECDGSVTFQIETSDVAPQFCSACDAKFPDAIKEAMKHYHESLKLLRASKAHIRFRISQT
ncbi:MAG TPA: hypothetical protein VJN90_08600 [Candidatus Acidoferrales bacterium]|nr:hypothetical protein [Candidatus Acidoferrales bacterium]